MMWKRLLVAIPLAVLGAVWFYFVALPWPVLLRVRDPQATAVMRQRIAEARAEGDDLEIQREWVPLERISRRLRRAVVVAEDGRFYEHDGVDWQALREEFHYSGDVDFSWFDGGDLRALLGSLNYYRKNRDRVRGRSTITQQLAKNLYFSTDRSTLRKFDEFIVARRLETFLSKDRILELYLNLVEWGPGIFGAEAAARHYFDRPASELSGAQAAALAATLPHPLTSNPRLRPGRMAWRQRLILARMGGSGPVRTVPLAPTPAAEAPLGERPTSEETREETEEEPEPAETEPEPVPVPQPPPDTIAPDTLAQVPGPLAWRRTASRNP